jgi:hypothetical protein
VSRHPTRGINIIDFYHVFSYDLKPSPSLTCPALMAQEENKFQWTTIK